MRSLAPTRCLTAVLLTLLAWTSVAAAQATSDAPVRYDTDYLSADFHRSRREAVLAFLPQNGVAVIFGAATRNRSNDVSYEYRQSSDFLYLTGSEEPGSVLLLAPGGLQVDGRRVREILFVPPRDPAQEVWLGRRFGTERAMSELGMELAVENTRYEEIVTPLLQSPRHEIFQLPLPVGVEPGTPLAEQLETFLAHVGPPEPAAPGRQAPTLRLLLDELRTLKTPEEMVLLQRAIDITTEAHRQVMTQVRPGWAEYEIEALVEYTFKRLGAEQPGFPSIVGSAENSVILHYETNRRVTEPGDVVVIDVGAEVHGYSADVTRTIPVSGRYSPEQRQIYEVVYAAQEAGIAASRAGNPLFATHQATSRVLAEGLARLGLIAGPNDQAGLRRFFMHGTSHYLGLDVHDVGSGAPMQPGTVITVEPGIYIAAAEDVDPKWWNIGVRIEDDILITNGDPVILSRGVPRQIDQIEALMAGRPVS